MKKVGGHLIADGNAINIDIGFVPDKFMAVHGVEETNPVIEVWYRELANTANSNGQYGLSLATGTVAKFADADNGFAEYDTYGQRVKLPAPNGSGETIVTLAADFAAGAAQPTARSATVNGTTVRPSTHNGYVYECTTSAGTYGTEPTWGTTVGETTSDGTNTWTCRAEKVIQGGAKGITIGSTISTDTDEWCWEAELWDKVNTERDSASYDPV